MNTFVPEEMLLLAGSGDYPVQAVRGMRLAGVKRIVVEGCVGNTPRVLRQLVDEIRLFRFGEFEKSLDWLAQQNIRHIMLAGQVNPLSLFTAKFDHLSRTLLSNLPVKNAHTIFGAWTDEIQKRGLNIVPASCFMDEHIPGLGTLTERNPDDQEMLDIQTGHKLGLSICDLDVGQTILLKHGMILAVEAFEGTNAAIKRGAKLGGKGAVLVKVAKNGHDMRFDIPVFGMTTLKLLKRCGVTAAAYQAHRLVMLQRKQVIEAANRWGITLYGIDSGLPIAPTRPAN